MKKQICIKLLISSILFQTIVALAAPEIIIQNKEFIVDNLTEKSESGNKIISTNIFNRGYADAALVIYDKNGTIVGIQQIPGAGPDPSPISWTINNPVRLYAGITDEYKWYDARDSANESVKKTETVFIIPEGGRVEVSKTSNIALAFNAMNIAISLFDEINVLPSGAKISEKKFLAFSEKLLDSDLYSKMMAGNIESSDLMVLLSAFVETMIDPDNLDGRKSAQKFIKEIAGKFSGPLTVAGWIGKGLNISGKLIDISTYDNNDGITAKNDIDTIESHINQNPCATLNYVCNPTLGNVVTGINQGQNSHFGAANLYTGWGQPSNIITQIPTVIDPINNGNAQLVTGLQQAAQTQNSTAFESTDWIVKSGNPAINFSIRNSFGSITAPNSGPIAALNNADVVSTTMERTFFIPAGVKQVTVGMLANFVTNEYPTYVGSQYNDTSTIEIKTGSGNVYQATLFNKTLNSANFTLVNGLPNPLSSTGGQTGFEAVSKTISVANGGALTITVKTTNVGDTAVPSATLINSTKVK